MRRFGVGEEKLRREMESVSQPLSLNTGTWWWVWGKAIKNGRVTRVLRGPYPDESACFEAGNSLMGKILVSFECVPLSTRDTAQASRVMRNKVAEETKSTEETFRRFKHKVKESYPSGQSEPPSAWVGPEG